MQHAVEYLQRDSRPKGTKVVKVVESAESVVFKTNFTSWHDPIIAATYGYQPGKAAKKKTDTPMDIVGGMLDGMKNMMGGSRSDSKTFLSDVEPLSVDVWRIEDFKEVPLEKQLIGQFYAGDSYIVKEVYKVDTKEECIIYYWQGSQSSQDEKGASAIIATRMDDEMGGSATQVRVVMGKEPSHFVRLFHGTMVIHSGGKASGFANRTEGDSFDTDGISLFHVRGTEKDDTRAVQVEEKASSLNSGDCFVLLTPETIYMWQGSGANTSEVDTATQVAETLKFKRTLESVIEGAEPDAFWEALGGKGEYPSEKVSTIAC